LDQPAFHPRRSWSRSRHERSNDTGKPPRFAKDWTLLAVAGHDGKSLRPGGSFDVNGEY